jgi:hypothetical protein
LLTAFGVEVFIWISSLKMLQVASDGMSGGD